MHHPSTRFLLSISVSILIAALPAKAEDPNVQTLAKAVQNPVANLISVPFQSNFNFGIGPNDVTQWVLNVQPVIPIHLSEDWNLITRTIVPIINHPSLAPIVVALTSQGPRVVGALMNQQWSGTTFNHTLRGQSCNLPARQSGFVSSFHYSSFLCLSDFAI